MRDACCMGSFGTDLAQVVTGGGWRRCRLLKPRRVLLVPGQALERRPVLPLTARALLDQVHQGR